VVLDRREERDGSEHDGGHDEQGHGKPSATSAISIPAGPGSRRRWDI
jgi:hypothetical protein